MFHLVKSHTRAAGISGVRLSWMSDPMQKRVRRCQPCVKTSTAQP